MRNGMDTGLKEKNLIFGLSSAKTSEVGSYSIATYAFIYQYRNVTVSLTSPGDVIITLARISADPIHRKGRKHRRLLALDYTINLVW